MISTSSAYLTAIDADSEQTTFSAQFSFIPPGSREGLTLSQSGFARWGTLSQLNNRILTMDEKWASLELNRSILGGGWRYYDASGQIGEWSIAQSDENGNFAVKPYVEMVLDKPYDLIGVQIIFDEPGEEWASKITVDYYGVSGGLLNSQTFENERANRLIDFQQNGVKVVRLTIGAWNLPRRFAKICQVIPGQIRKFTGENIYTFRMLEKMSPFDSLTIPEYTIVFPNENQEYNIINPGGAVSKLRELMEIPSKIGLVTAAGVEYVSTGNFFLFSWPSSTSDEIMSFACRPDLAFSTQTYENVGGDQTVATIAARISAQAALHTPVAVDGALSSVMVRGAVGDRQTPLSSALGQLAIAAGGVIKFERDGTYTLKPLDYTPTGRVITFDNMWSKPTIVQQPLVFGVTVRYLAEVDGRLEGAEAFVSSGNAMGRNIEVISNFILTVAEAQRIGSLALEFFNHRLQYRIDYRGDMSIEAGDVVGIETDYGVRNVLILEHEIRYGGTDFLQGSIVGVEV